MSVPPEPLILLFALSSPSPSAEGLETRVKNFLAQEPTNESLDSEAFDKANGSDTKADWLLANRMFVGEMKTLNGDPLDRVERRVQDRFAQPGAPIVFGTMGMGPVLGALPDQDEVLKVIHDLSARAVRSNLKKSSDQIGAIKDRFSLPSAAGLTILLNESEEMIDAANIGYSVIKAFREHPKSYAQIDYIWASIESTRIRTASGAAGYAQLLICKDRQPPRQHLNFLAQMLGAWAAANGTVLEQIDHRGDWAIMQPIYKNGPPSFSLFK